jgi:hypothetical protein
MAENGKSTDKPVDGVEIPRATDEKPKAEKRAPRKRAPKKEKEEEKAARVPPLSLQKLAPMPKRKGGLRPLHDCECGCGGKTQARFVPGHDSILRGWMLRVERGLIKLSEMEKYGALPGQRKSVEAHLRAKHEAEGKKKRKVKVGAEAPEVPDEQP